MKYDYDERDYQDPEITADDKECAFIICTVIIECGDDTITLMNDEGEESPFFKCLDVNEENFNDEIVGWFNENNLKYDCKFEDEYEYDSYEYPVGFENLTRHCYYTIIVRDDVFLALKMRWL